MKSGTFQSKLWTTLLLVGLAAIVFCLVVFGVLQIRISGETLDEADSVNRELVSIVSNGFWQSELFKYQQGLQYAYFALQGVVFDSDEAMLDSAVQMFERTYITLPPDVCVMLARDSRIVAALTRENKEFVRLDTDQVHRLLQDAHFEYATEVSEILSIDATGPIGLYNSEDRDTSLLVGIPTPDGAMLYLLLPEAESHNMIGALYQLQSDNHQRSVQRIGTQVRNALIVMVAFCVFLAGALVLVAKKLSATVSQPVVREQQRQQMAIEQAERENQMMAEVDRRKTEFLANISHELKTPLTVVSSHIQSLRAGLPDGRLPQSEADRMLDVTGGEVDRMAVMIHQLLDISRIEEGRMQMYITQASIIEIAQFTLDNYYPAFTKGGNRLRFAREGDVPDVKCDRARIVQVLVNLIGNATRHTRRGEIEVVVSAADGFAEVCVRDNGDGMSTEQLEHLFERYRTSSRESSGAQGLETGTGLGLFICQHIINAHGGRIWIESESGHGTRAHFTVPLDT